jgi:hypothetical protein
MVRMVPMTARATAAIIQRILFGRRTGTSCPVMYSCFEEESNDNVGDGSVCLGSGIASVACGSIGAERTDPSIKQKVNESSKVRLQVGQLFIGLMIMSLA